MDTITRFLEHYSYRFPKGYPDLTDPADKKLIYELLSEVGINEAINNDSITFENFIKQKYIEEKQSISGLDSLYDAIQKSSEKEKLFSLIEFSGNKQLSAGKSSIQNVEGTLFNLIMSFIKMDNGDASELWFAIIYNGKAKGGVASETGIESDIDVGNQGISLKNYKTINTLDFGSLPAKELKQLKQIINLLVVLTGVEFTAGIGRDSLNNLLITLKDPSFQADIRGILKIGEDTQIKALQNTYNTIMKYVPDGDVEKLVDEFIDGDYGINKLIADKITKVKWWAVINKNTLYLEPSDVIVNRLNSKEGQLSPVFGQIKGNNLFINGNRLFSDTTEEK
jgi:hypothetical protein